MELLPRNPSGGRRPGPSSSPLAGAARWLLLLLLTLGLPLAASAQGAAAGSDRVVLAESILPVADAAAATAAPVAGAVMVRANLSDAEAAAPMKVEAVLQIRNYEELRRRVAAQEVLTPDEMAAKFLPLEADAQRVVQWLAGAGLNVSPVGPGQTIVFAWGTPAQLQDLFRTSFGRVNFKGAEYTATLSAPSVPAEIAPLVAAINGLQPYLHPEKFAAPIADISNRPPFLVSEILGAYDAANTGLTGAGQEICIIIDAFPADSDLTKFWQVNKINQSLSNIVKVDLSTNGIPAPSGEETLDVSWSSGIASGAQVLIYGTGDLGNVGAAYNRLITDLQTGKVPNLHQLSMSYGAGETTDASPGYLRATSQLFTTISAYGVTIFASSGDNGAYGSTGRTVQVSYPASDPNIVGVGGTSLTLNAATGAEGAESAWSPSPDGQPDPTMRIGASGGGVSGYFSRPAYQTGSTLPAGTMRLVPDVSLTADPNTGCFLVLNGQTAQYGGTSWSSPSWAGLCALINQARAAANLKPVGVINTSFYPLQGTTSFRDITTGTNNNLQTGGGYDAGPGFDLVTGIGVPHFSTLVQALLGNIPAPVITSPTAASGQVGAAFSYQIAATNIPLSFGASGLPAGLTIDVTTGIISGTPTAAGASPVLLTASNNGGTASATLTLTISAAGSQAPTVTGFAPNSGPAGTQVTITGTNFVTAAGGVGSVSFNGVSAAFTVSSATVLTATVPAGATTGPITVKSAAGTGASAMNFFVTAAGQAPVITNANSASARVGTPFSFQITASNSPTGFNAVNLPPGLLLTAATGVISGTPTTAGSYQVTLSATNAVGTGTAALVVTVLPALPVITSAPAATGAVGSPFTYQITASNTPASYSATGLPAGLRVNAATGLISGTPTAAGTYQVALSATNGGGTGTAALTLTITLPVPVITSALTGVVQQNAAYTYQITANANPVSYGASGLPAGLSVNPATGVISGAATARGSYAITLSASNASGTGTATLNLTVLPPPPAISGSLSTQAQVGVAFTYQIVASNSPATYGANGLPDGLTLDPFSGLITGAPTQNGTFQVTLSAVNVSGAGTATLSLFVLPAPPVIVGSLTASANEFQAFSYQIAATNAPTVYGAAGLPTGLTLNAAAGLITGAPTQFGTFQITLSASNTGGTGTAALVLTVAPPPPVITSGLTATVQMGSPFSFQVAATNAPTLYNASNVPAGVGLNQATGLLLGTPLAVGTYAVPITATNQTGTASATLTITVTPIPPVVTLAATKAQLTSARGNAGQFTITRTGGDQSQPLKVFYAVKGSAESGVDYVVLRGTKTIAANKSFARVNVVSLGSDLNGESRKLVKVVLEPPADNSYTVGAAANAKVKIFAAQ